MYITRGTDKYVLQSATINNDNNVVKYYSIARTHNRNIAILAIVGLSLFILFVFFFVSFENNLSLNSYLYIHIYITYTGPLPNFRVGGAIPKTIACDNNL